MNALTIAQIMEKMIAFSEGNIHDIDHLIRVWTYAKTIGEREGLDANTQYEKMLRTSAQRDTLSLRSFDLDKPTVIGNGIMLRS